MKKRILLIDDDPLVLKSLSNLLQSKGYVVTGCESGFEAVSAFKKDKFDLIISDIRMAGLDGIATVKIIREIGNSSGSSPIPIIMITGYANEKAPVEAIKIGVQDYFLKPFDNEELIQSIESHLQRASEHTGGFPIVNQRTQFNVLGIGIVSPLGHTKEAFWDRINECKTFYRQISDGRYPSLKGFYCMRVESFSPSHYFDEKQLHNVDDNSAFLAGAAKFAIEDSELKVTKIGSDDVGVAVGTSVSIATSMSDFNESVLRYGNRRSSIGIFPNTVICAPASRVSIFEHITGSNTTISSGMNSGFDAIGYACLCLEDGQTKIMIAGGSDAISEKILLGYAKEDLLFREPEKIQPNKRGTFVPSEGACNLLLGRFDKEHPEPQVYCQILSCVTGFSPFKKRQTLQRTENLFMTLQSCLSQADIGPDAIDCVLLSSFFDEYDAVVESKAVERLLGEHGKRKPILAPKKILGESFGSFAPEAVVVAVGIFKWKVTQTAIKYLNQNQSFSGNAKIRHILLVHIDSGGHDGAMVLKSTET